MEIPIENIIVKSNPRTDFGDIDELTASVREKGVLEPVLVKELEDNKYELIAGERRYRASKAAGKATIPAALYSGDANDIEEVKLIENMHRKDLNPVEEGIAFKKYMDETKASIERLAQKISKPKLYIERRLALLDLADEVKAALSGGKILLGHALTLARLNTASQQKKMLKEIIRDKMGVEETERNIHCNDFTARLNNAVFDKSECKGCRHNGGEQSLLFDSGSELKGICLNSKCFLKKTREWKQAETKKLKEQGIKVLTPAENEKLKVKERVSTWDDDYKKILKKLSKEPENYAVVFEDNYSGIPEKRVYCLNPKARHPKQKTKSGEKAAAVSREEKLTRKVGDFKRNFLIAKTGDLMQPGTKETKAMNLYVLFQEGNNWNDRDKRDATEQILLDAKLTTKRDYGYSDVRFGKILALDESEIDRLICRMSALWAKDLGSELDKGAMTFGVNIKKHFMITEDYLKLHTKDQLIALAKEIGLDKHLEKEGNENWEKAKLSELKEFFLGSGFDLKGKVPKSILDAR